MDAVGGNERLEQVAFAAGPEPDREQVTVIRAVSALTGTGIHLDGAARRIISAAVLDRAENRLHVIGARDGSGVQLDVRAARSEIGPDVQGALGALLSRCGIVGFDRKHLDAHVEVTAPLLVQVGERVGIVPSITASSREGERSVGVGDHGRDHLVVDVQQGERLGRFGRSVGGRSSAGVEAEVVDAPVPAVGAGVGEAEAHFGLVVGAAHTEELVALGLDAVVIDAALDERGQAGGDRSTDEGTVSAADDSSSVVGVVGHVAVFLVEGGFGVQGSVLCFDEVGFIDEISQRQPLGSAIDGIFHARDAVLVLLPEALEGHLHVGATREVVIGRRDVHHLAAADRISRGAEEETALGQRFIQDLPVHHVGRVDHVHPLVVRPPVSGVFGIVVGDEAAVEPRGIHSGPIGIRRRAEVAEVELGVGDFDVGLAGPTGGHLSFGNRIEVLEHQRRGQFDVAVVGHLERIGDVEGLGRDTGVREGQHIDVRRGGGQQHRVGEGHRGLLGGAGHRGRRGFAVQRQADRRERDAVGQFGPVRGVRRHSGGVGGRARGGHACPTDDRDGHGDGLTGEDRVSVVLQQVGAVFSDGGQALLQGD